MLYTDDDAEYTADSVMRLLMFLSYLRPEYHSAMVGGAMLFNDKPNTIWANGEQLTKTNIKFNKRGLDLTDIPQLREADTEIVGDNQYLGWWFCAFPLRYGQPLPFFFQYDDIEFSLRYKDAAKITLPGICALHENFEKRYNNTREYYALRNRLFTCSAHLKYTRFDAILALGYVVARNLLCFRYKNVDLALRASRDFRKGLPALYRVDAEALHNEIRAYAYKDEGVLVPVHEQEKIRDIMERGYADVNYKTKTMRNLWRLFVPGRGQCYAPAGRPLYVASEKSAIIVNFEPETGVSYVTKKQISQNLVGIIRYCGEAICILCGYHRTNSRKK
jgi:galactofuranosylgalactofuranosylrhamnosyl-N-acetylglucosaminyl-diphospho-decaprenol beta-1,5/1,6-galactofuranosyltransferase